jgi:hypothetical protein
MTPSELKMLDYIREYLDQRGLAPTGTEAARHFDVSPSRANRIVKSLIAQGRLTRSGPGRRSLDVPAMPDMRSVPTSVLRGELARRGVTLDALRRPERRDFSGHSVTCAVDCCDVVVRRGHLMCWTHWTALPMKLRTGILAAFVAKDEQVYGDLVWQAREIAATARAA